MELNAYIEALRVQLATAAAAAGDEAMELAERLTGPLDAAARLILQDALSDAAQEITRELAPGSVELRLRGRELIFVVTPAPTFDAADEQPGGDLEVAAGRGSESPGEGTTSRITFRPPDFLKARIEDAAEREGLSVNAFLVRTLTSALDPGRTPSSRTDRTGATRVDGWFR
ncbi:MAG: hypothetical protein DLM67_10345 [Candidatus Nephthysia bennettiae]|uniref:Toxin-antitoxin system HicB family antitoxin n=1 Tax=Candidatus Nephthysia bennettiae TaxID=3127016 RepID=A0A934ND15_9BACT|nr:hypothetical protein [Candidatus Dormibacteraeota bacterium]PZR95837.1 MAG: hypothetical protein DLM67_10345 [Candidatus Dormibacteraeota bacterium]